MEFLQSVLEGVISQNQQNTIKMLEMQNASLKTQNTYFQKIIEYNQLSYRNFSSESLDEHQDLNHEHICRSEYQDQENSERNRNYLQQLKEKVNRKTKKPEVRKIDPSQLNLKFSTEEIQCSLEIGKGVETPPQSTSFMVNLKENGSQDLSNNCISSIDPVSETSSFPSSQKSFIKSKNQPKLTPKNQVFTVSLRQQLSSLNSDSKRTESMLYSESRRKRPVKRISEDEENEQNLEPEQYQFKYLKF